MSTALKIHAKKHMNSLQTDLQLLWAFKKKSDNSASSHMFTYTFIVNDGESQELRFSLSENLRSSTKLWGREDREAIRVGLQFQEK